MEVLVEIVDDNWNGHNYDIRGSLMQCEILCESRREDCITIMKRISPLEQQEVVDLSEYVNLIDLNSSADIIQSLSMSQFQSTLQANELDDIYWIDDSTQTKLSPYELNIGDVLLDQVSKYKLDRSTPDPVLHMNDLRHETKTFLGSRARYILNIGLKRTRNGGGSISMLETVGVSDTSCLNHVNNTSFILDILPFARNWSRYQKAIDEFETNAIAQCEPSVKQFLKYRDFSYESTLEATIKYE